MQELFPENGRQFTLISDQSDQIIKEQGIVEAFELLEFTKKVQCIHCQRFVTSGHICCCFGRTLCLCPFQSRHCRADTAQREATVRVAHDTCLPAGKRTKQEAKPRTIFDVLKRRDTHPFLTDGIEMVCTERQLNVGWSEDQVKQMDVLGFEKHTYHARKEERQPYSQFWMIKRNTDDYTPQCIPS